MLQDEVGKEKTVPKSESLENMIKKESILSYDAMCVRKKSNWGKVSKIYKFDEENFQPQTLLNDMPDYSPKLEVLLDKIDELDRKDMKEHGKMFKHFIFSDLKSTAYGAKIIASALIAKGMKLGYEAKQLKPGNSKKNDIDDEMTGGEGPGKKPKKEKRYGKIEMIPLDVLQQTQYNNFYLLASISIYDQPINTKTKKEILANFNKRPDNVYGENVRIIVMDSGFKEGIDLFDIKYVHLYEPSTVASDEKQVIGRGTRTCGQKGLDFHPQKGWPLHVFIYDLMIPDKLQKTFLNSKSAIELYLKAMNLDIRLLNFAHDLEKTSIIGSVDYDLNKNIHSFSIPMVSLDNGDVNEHLPGSKEAMYNGGGPKRRLVLRDGPPIIIPAPQRLGFEAMREHIQDQYSEFTWTNVKMENLCEEKQKGGAGTIINFTPTQDFVRHYFTPTNPVKGMLLYHSVGTGKTCSAIAAATNNFEKQGYTILWVTRTTLKSDIWKNMFDMVCSESIRHEIQTNDLKIPDEQDKRMRLLSKSWKIRPMSYKQFSNLVSKQNSLYDDLVKINGKEDPLRKTLLIIDEAHKLYGGDDLSSLEKPDMNALHKALMYSYQYSGINSVKLLLMTATPITNNPMELIKLLNLCKPQSEQMPEDFTNFSGKYLNNEGEFTERGRMEYLDEISGYLSYLNREKDARQFAQPIIERINVPIVKDVKMVERFDKKIVGDFLNSDVPKLQQQIIDETNKIRTSEFADIDANKFKFLREEICGDLEGRPLKQCGKIVNANIRELVKEAKGEVKEMRENIKKIRQLVIQQKKLKQISFKEIKGNVENNAEKYKKYKESLFYLLKNTCAKKITSETNFKEAVKEHPEILETDNLLASYNEEIENLHGQIKNQMTNYKNRMAHLKGILKKKDLSELERSVIKLTIKDEQKDFKGLMKATKKTVSKAEKEIKKKVKTTEKQRKKNVEKIRKTIKKQIKVEKKNEKDIEKEEKKLRKTLRKERDYVEEIKDEKLNDLVGKYKNKALDQMVDLNEEMLEAEKERENIKMEKMREREHMRQTKKANKEREQQEKKIVKAAEQQRKKEEKLREKEDKKAEKERQRGTLKLQKEAARKTKKNQK
uniref:Helicase ATP-binding domain-containing protein n=1 Tax=viral metagenome TaxID=1070528 RepID=A0A6C0JHK5_9ZZZZ